ncbi:hypothetical protein M9H77_29686 [Catharanthus roseus]|uniref:Uncharacterized protein n=1 Tax=Catharanthus roseus TaxID=4058 RepID=A0ACB9ZX24_CATRO|nr:hypothetical protein M9H77_29686 [Catharanthus roseus]
MENVSSTFVWVRLPELPIELFNEITTTINNRRGRAIKVDITTLGANRAIEDGSKVDRVLSAVYASPAAKFREELWQHLCCLGHYMTSPWCLDMLGLTIPGQSSDLGKPISWNAWIEVFVMGLGT